GRRRRGIAPALEAALMYALMLCALLGQQGESLRFTLSRPSAEDRWHNFDVLGHQQGTTFHMAEVRRSQRNFGVDLPLVGEAGGRGTDAELARELAGVGDIRRRHDHPPGAPCPGPGPCPNRPDKPKPEPERPIIPRPSVVEKDMVLMILVGLLVLFLGLFVV